MSKRKHKLMSVKEFRKWKRMKNEMREERKNMSTPLQMHENLIRALKGEALTVPLSQLNATFRRQYYQHFDYQYYYSLDKNDPARIKWFEQRSNWRKKWQRKRFAKIKKDPVKYEIFKQKSREYNRRKMEKIKNDPIERIIHNDKMRKYNKNRTHKKWLTERFHGDKKTFEWWLWMRDNKIEKYYKEY